MVRHQFAWHFLEIRRYQRHCGTFSAETPLQDPITLGVTRRRHSGSLRGPWSNCDSSDLGASPKNGLCRSVIAQNGDLIPNLFRVPYFHTNALVNRNAGVPCGILISWDIIGSYSHLIAMDPHFKGQQSHSSLIGLSAGMARANQLGWKSAV